MIGYTKDVHLSCRKFDDEEHVELFEPHVSTVKKSVASTLCAWERRNSDQVGPLRGAGPSRCRRRTRRIELAETQIPIFRSSPWTRIHPQLRFSRPRRTMRSIS